MATLLKKQKPIAFKMAMIDENMMVKMDDVDYDDDNDDCGFVVEDDDVDNDDDNVILHWREEGCIGNYAPRGPRDCPRAKPEGNLEGRGGRNFQYIPPLVSVITFFFPRRGCFDFSFWPAHSVL